MSFGFFIITDTPESSPILSGNPVRVCLGGNIGRVIGPGQVQSTGPTGFIDMPLDLNAVPSATGLSPATVGERLYIQTWYRDQDPTGALTARLSDAYQFTVLP